MRWLASLLISAACAAQPADLVDAIRGARTPEDLIRIIDQWERGEMASGVQSIEWNGRAIPSGGLSFAVARAGTAYQEDGTACASNVARYAGTRLVAGAPNMTTISGFAGAAAFRPLHSGYASDGTTPVLVVRRGDKAELQVHARTEPENYWNSSDTTGSYITTLGTNGDILYQQTSSNGGTAAIANHEFQPGSAAVWKGYVVVGCDHLYNDGGGFDSVGCALAYTTIDRLSGANPWILLAVTEAVNIGPTAHHQAWSLSKFEISDTLCLFIWTDYGTSTRDGGNAQASFLDISSGSPVWKHTRLHQNYRTGGTNDEHFHTGGVIRLPNGDTIFVISIGDGYKRNRLVFIRVDAADIAAGNFTNGTTYSHPTYGDTGIGGSYVIQEPHANWPAAAVCWGGTDDGNAGRAYRHNQVINMIQADAACSALLCATDETSPALIRCEWDDTNNVPSWSVPYLPAVSSANPDGAVNFVISGNPGGPFVAKFGGDSWDDSGTGGSGVADLEACIMYSPDGTTWGQIADWQSAAQYAAILHAGKVYCGTASADTPKYFPVPIYRTTQPLQIASTPANSMDSGISASTPTGVSTGVSITDLATDGSDLPAAFGGELPPCDRGPMVLVNVTGDLSADRQNYGNWTVATGLPDSFTDICVRAWVRAVPYDGSTFNNKATAALWTQLQKTTTPNEAFSGGARIFGPDKWTPITIFALKSQFTATISGTWSLRLQMRADGLNTNTTPCQFVLCLEGVYLDGSMIRSSGGVAAGGSALTETGTVSGFTKRPVWSLYGELIMAHDQWDSRTGGKTPGGANTAGSSMTATPTLFRLKDSAGSDTLDVKADVTNYRVILASDTTTGNGTSNKRWWRRGDSLPVVITCDGTTTTLYYETTDGAVTSVAIADAMQVDQAVTLDPVLLSRLIMKDGIDGNPTNTLRTLASGAEWDDYIVPPMLRSRVAPRRLNAQR